MYAVIEAGGKQYRVSPGDVIQIDSEQIKVTLGGGTSVLDVVRGYNGTTPAPHLSAGGTNPIYRVTYDRRFDLNGDGQIRLQDVLLMKPFFSLTCT